MTTEAPPAPEATATPAETTATVVDTTQQQTTPSPFGTDGKFVENWHLSLGDEFAPHAETLKRFGNVTDLAKSYVHLRGTGPGYPGENATTDEIARFRQLAKVPASPAEYGIQKPENLPPGMEWNESFLGEMAAVAHKHHIPGPAFHALVQAQLAHAQTHAQTTESTRAAEIKAAQDGLVAEWRGDYENNLATVRHLTSRYAERAGIPEDSPHLAALMNNPDFARIVHQVSTLTAEDGIRAPSGMGDLRTPRQVANDIMSGKDEQWGAKYMEGDRAAMEHVGRLLQKAEEQ
jgi:hypothetical protein